MRRLSAFLWDVMKFFRPLFLCASPAACLRLLRRAVALLACTNQPDLRRWLLPLRSQQAGGRDHGSQAPLHGRQHGEPHHW